MCCSSTSNCSSLHALSFSMSVLQSAGCKVWRWQEDCYFNAKHNKYPGNLGLVALPPVCRLTASVGVFFNLLLSTFIVAFYLLLLSTQHMNTIRKCHMLILYTQRHIGETRHYPILNMERTTLCRMVHNTLTVSSLAVPT